MAEQKVVNRAEEPTALAEVIPAGPAHDVADTVASVVHFTSAPRCILVVDDTGGDVHEALEALSDDVHVIRAPWEPRGPMVASG